MSLTVNEQLAAVLLSSLLAKPIRPTRAGTTVWTDAPTAQVEPRTRAAGASAGKVSNTHTNKSNATDHPLNPHPRPRVQYSTARHTRAIARPVAASWPYGDRAATCQ